MKNKLFSILALVAFSALSAFGQTALSSTTLGAAVTTTNQTNITLASTSTMLSRGAANSVDTVLYVDQEFMQVITVVDSTHVIVRRAAGPGAAGRPATHMNGAKVYFAITTTTQPANSYFKNGSLFSEVSGGCVAGNEVMLPLIYLTSGHIWDCKGGTVTAPSQWILVSTGATSVPAGRSISSQCTGTVASAETEYVLPRACSGSTGAAGFVVPVSGTVANFQASSSANFLGTGGSTFTVLKNAVATAIVCAPTAATKTCSDTAHSFQVLAGDVISVTFLSATSDTGANISVSMSIY